MTSSRKIVAAALCAISAGMINVTLAAPPAKDVNVVNTPDVIVVSMPPIDAQVTGTIDTNVVNTPDVNVVNTADINVINTPGVTIENGPNDPIPVTMNAAARVPYQGIANFGIPAGMGNSLSTFFPSLPTSGVLVIEQVNIRSILPRNFLPTVFDLRTEINEIRLNHSLNLPTIMDTGLSVWTAQAAQAVRLYHDLSLGALEVVYGRYPEDEGAGAIVTVSGYIVPAGSPSLAP